MRDSETPHQNQLAATARQLLNGATGIAATTSLAIVVISGIVAPGASPGAWTWLRVFAIWLLVTIALSTIATVSIGGRANATTSPLIVWGALLLAVLVSLSFNALATALTVLALILLLLAVPGTGSPLTFWAAVVTVTPLWVWSAFDAWDRWLLMLVPIAAIGLVSLEHAVRAGHAGGDPRESMAAWIGLLALAASTLLVAILDGIDPSWITSAAVAVVILAPIDLGLARAATPLLSPIVLPASALVTLGFGWMAAL